MDQKTILLFRSNNGNTLYSWNGRQILAVDNETGQITSDDLLRKDSNKLDIADEEVLQKVLSSKRMKSFKLKSSDRKEFLVVGRVSWDLY